MDAEFIPQEQVSQEQLFVNIIYKSIAFLEKVKQGLKSKQLFIILLWLCRYYEDMNIFDLSIDRCLEQNNIIEKLLINKYNSEAKKIRLILYRLRTQILETLYRTSKKYLIQKYFNIFHRLYKQNVKLNVGDIVIYRKCNPNFTINLCIIKNITSKNYVLETIYTNAKTFRKNLYGEENYGIENENGILQLELFDKIFMDKQQFRINKNTEDIGFHINKIYKNNEGIYTGTIYQVLDFMDNILKI
tara:strand:- start:2290 stop:3024 length:735 start_codon:yes stop_codon:yes gene_type:complete